MPKVEMRHEAGRRLDERVREALGHFISDLELERLERLGGRILVSVSVANGGGRKRSPQMIDAAFVAALERDRDRPERLKDTLSTLTMKDMRRLSEILGHPMRPSATAAVTRAELLRHLQAESRWHRISSSV